MRKVEVGMQVYLVPTNCSGRLGVGAFYCTVVKVGRKWATTDYYGRFDIEAMRERGESYIDGIAYSPFKVYLSRDEFDKNRSRAALIRSVRDAVVSMPLDIDKAVKIADILGIEHDVKI